MGQQVTIVKINGSALTFGRNNYGQLGQGSVNNSANYINITTSPSLDIIKSGFNHMAGISGNTLYT